jgi:hypothetical protein
MYAALGSRPDIAFAVQQLSQHCHDFAIAHWTAVKRVIRYLKGTRDLGIIFRRSAGNPQIDIYIDADFANLADSKSIGGYFCIYGGSVIAWLSKKQSRIALSTTESESMALIPASKHGLWVHHLLNELDLPSSDLINLYCDNLQTISNIQDASLHARTKHLRVECHWVRELVDHNEMGITYIKSEDNLADILTKALPLPQHEYLLQKLGMF